MVLYLPNLYNYILEQSKDFSKEALQSSCHYHAYAWSFRRWYWLVWLTKRPKKLYRQVFWQYPGHVIQRCPFSFYCRVQPKLLVIVLEMQKWGLEWGSGWRVAWGFAGTVLENDKAGLKGKTDTFGREKCPDAGLHFPLYPPSWPICTIDSRKFREREQSQGRGGRFSICR